ncbi:MAG: dihydrolipoamide dehydrogenase [Candidatus Latescibacterota bacterium]
MSNNSFDLVVIGAGPGGYVAAARASELGMSVACIDKNYLGGTCLNVGCIPSKALLESSELYYRSKKGLEQHGITLGEIGLDLTAMMARKEKIVGNMTKGIEALFKGHSVASFAGTGRLLGDGKVEVAGADGKQVLEAQNVLLATGSTPVQLPALPFDGAHIISSTEALELKEVPHRMVVIGAGAIGLEMGSVWSRLGAEVLVVEFMEQILPGMERELADQLQRLLKRQGMDFKLQTSARGFAIKKGRVELQLAADGKESAEMCDVVLVAVGRRPVVEGLGLEEGGVELDERGRIKIDAHGRTSAEGVWAIGDLVPGPMLAHKAEAEGVAAVERMVGKAGQVNYEAIPGVVYTHPELATVGLSEEMAKEQGREVSIGKYQFRANARAHCMDEIDGLVKIVADAKTDRLLGMHILGAQASNLIAEGVLALEFGASAEDVARTVHAHPALSEVVKEAAWAVGE